MKKPFRLKDPKTELYYCPSRKVAVNPDKIKYGMSYVKSNLSKKGKIYLSTQKLEKQIYDHTDLVEETTWLSGRKSYRSNLRLVTFIEEYITFND